MKIVWLAVIAAAFAMALLFSALANGDYAAAQTADTPTPVPTAEQHDGSSVQDLPPIEAKSSTRRNTPTWIPTSTASLQQVQTGQFTAQAAAASAPVHSGASVAVTLYITEGYADAIVSLAHRQRRRPAQHRRGLHRGVMSPCRCLPRRPSRKASSASAPSSRPSPRRAAVVSEGAAAHGAPAWHAAGIKGQGVKIGIIDTGFEGFRSLMGTELPASVQQDATPTSACSLQTSRTATTPAESKLHGTAVTEAAFDIAPEATYYISNPISVGRPAQTAVEWMV